MTLDISLSDREVGVDPVAAVFRVSALVADHALRARQAHINHDVDLGSGLRGRVTAVDYKTVTITSPDGQRRNVPITSRRAAILATPPTTPRVAAATPKVAAAAPPAAAPPAGAPPAAAAPPAERPRRSPRASR